MLLIKVQIIKCFVISKMSSSTSAQCSKSAVAKCDCIVECERCLARKRYSKNYYNTHIEQSRLNSKKQNEKKKQELAQARETNALRDQIIADAEDHAKRIVKEARARAEQLEQEARARAKQIMDYAEAHSGQMIGDADDHATKIVKEARDEANAIRISNATLRANARARDEEINSNIKRLHELLELGNTLDTSL
jgi:vacuolar-type H+-ATPase subunit H